LELARVLFGIIAGYVLSLPYLSFHTEFLRDQIDFAVLAAMLSDHA